MSNEVNLMLFLKTSQPNQESRYRRLMRTAGDVVVGLSKHVRGIFGSSSTTATEVINDSRIPLIRVAIPNPELKSIVRNDVKTTNLSSLTSPKTSSVWEVMRSLSTLFWATENRSRVLGASVLTGVNIIFNFLAPYLLGKTIDQLNEDSPKPEAMMTILLAVAAYTSSPYIQSWRDQLLVPVAARNSAKLFTDIAKHQLGNKALDYHTNAESGDQFTLLSKGYTVANTVTPLLTRVAPTVAEIFITAIVLYNRYGIGMPIGIATVTAIFSKYSAATAQNILDANENSRKESGNAGRTMTRAIKNYKVMHDFGRFHSTIEEVRQATSEASEAEAKAGITPLEIERGHIGISRTAMLLASLYVGWGVKSHVYTVQDFLLFFNYLNVLSSSLPSVGQALNRLLASYPDAVFVFSELAKPCEIVDLYPDTPLILDPNKPPSIRFENVTFAYPGKDDILKNVSFTVPAGQTIVLVGKAGCGKSTLFQLLYRYHELTKGRILIADKDITKVSRQSLQAHIGMFSQKPNLFNGTIRDNIKYGAPNPETVTDAEIFRLAEMVNLKGFILSFPERLNTPVGEDGNKLSGGQQQKVAILRGLLKGGRLRLLDEVTSALDSESAAQILDGIKKTSQGITSLGISHKLDEAQHAHQIVVLENGAVVGQGKHTELLGNCSLYQSLWDQKDHLKATDSKQGERPVARALWASMSKALHEVQPLTAAALEQTGKAHVSESTTRLCLT